jgi:hypothetical protein
MHGSTSRLNGLFGLFLADERVYLEIEAILLADKTIAAYTGLIYRTAAGAAMIGGSGAYGDGARVLKSIEVVCATQSLTASPALSSPARAFHGSLGSTTISSNHFIFHRR